MVKKEVVDTAMEEENNCMEEEKEEEETAQVGGLVVVKAEPEEPKEDGEGANEEEGMYCRYTLFCVAYSMPSVTSIGDPTPWGGEGGYKRNFA